MTLRFSPYHPTKFCKPAKWRLRSKKPKHIFYALDLRNAGHDFSIDDGFNLLKLHVKRKPRKTVLSNIASTYDPYDQISVTVYIRAQRLSPSPISCGMMYFLCPRILHWKIRTAGNAPSCRNRICSYQPGEKDKTGTFYPC